MKFLFDFFPVLLFFGVYKYGDNNQDWAHRMAVEFLGFMTAGGAVPASQSAILLATAAAIVATALQIGYLLVRGRKIDTMLWLSLGVILVAGGATIYFHDETFIKWKPTILYWAFAVVLLVAQVFYRKNLMRSVMEAHLNLPDPIWNRVGYTWILFFVAMGLLNLLVAFVVFRTDTSAWVSFKLFGFTGIFFAFTMIQAMMLSKYIKEEDA
jgi:intracellular septation protein